MTPEQLAAIRERAEGQAFAHSEMVAIGKGVGGLEVYRPDLYEDLEAWSRSTENDHADTALALLDHVEALRTRIETYDGLGITELHDRLAAVRELHYEDEIHTGSCTECSDYGTDLYPPGAFVSWPCRTIQAIDGDNPPHLDPIQSPTRPWGFSNAQEGNRPMMHEPQWDEPCPRDDLTDAHDFEPTRIGIKYRLEAVIAVCRKCGALR